MILLVLLLIAVALYGWGCITFRFLFGRFVVTPVVLTIWLGFCVGLSVIELIHLFFPIDWRVSAFIVGVGLSSACYLKNRTHSIGYARLRGRISAQPGLWVLGLILVVLTTLRAMDVPLMYDSGLYHFGTIRWNNEHPIVPGLGNLHWRLALNQSYFGFLALLNFSPLWDKGYAIGGVFLMTLSLVTLIQIAADQSRIWRVIFIGILFPYLYLLSFGIANPSPDIAIALVEIALLLYVFKFCAAASSNKPRCNQLQLVILFLCVALVTIKLSSIAFSAGCAATVLAISLYKERGFTNPLWKAGSLLAAFAMLHMGRGYLLAGAPFFPSSIGGAWSLPWAVGQGVAQFESELIYSWARLPGINSPVELASRAAWLPEWLNALPWSAKFQLGLVTSLTVINLSLQILKCTGSFARRFLVLYIPFIAALAFWFFTAPDLRFLGSILILFCAFSIWHFSENVGWAVKRWDFALQAVYRPLVILYSLLIAALLIKTDVSHIVRINDWPTVPRANVITTMSRVGLEVFVPEQGAQCWSAALPCAVVVHPDLKRQSLIFFSFFGIPVGYSLAYFIDR